MAEAAPAAPTPERLVALSGGIVADVAERAA